MPNEVPDYYAVLSVPPKASPEEIKVAFRRLAHRYHPDKNRGNDPEAAAAVERFNAVRIAYEVLGDAEKKAEYDSSRRLKNWLASMGRGEKAEEKKAPVPAPKPAPAPVPSKPKAKAAPAKASQPASAPAPSPAPKAVPPAPPSFPPNQPPILVGKDLETLSTLPLAVAVRGGRWEVEVGLGRKIACVVPAGIRSGTRLLFKGRGTVGADGHTRGDLSVVFDVKTEGGWLISGNDLIVYADVDVLEVLAHGDVVLADAPGGELRIKMPPGFRIGRKLIVPGKGLPAFGKSPAGDLHVKIVPVFPELTREQANAVRRLLSQGLSVEERHHRHDPRRRAHDVVEKERAIEVLAARGEAGAGALSEEEAAELKGLTAAFEAATGVVVGRWE